MNSLNQFVMEKDRQSKNVSAESANEKIDKSIEKKAKATEKEVGIPVGVLADEPYEDGAVEELSTDQLNSNMLNLLAKLRANEPFFVIGETGWGKTAVIKDLARRNRRAVITVYLDEALAAFMNGMSKGKRGRAQMEIAMPQWAAYMYDNPDKQFLLFFDNLNLATPEVMKALRSIVLENEICGIKFNNFIVGAAGNFAYEMVGAAANDVYENFVVSELSSSLKSRFEPIIVWQSGGEAEWKPAFNYMHKKWDDKVTPELIDKFAKCADIFDNPREVEHKILKFIYNIKQKSDERDWFDADYYKDRIEGIVKKDLTKHQKEEVDKLAEAMYNFINDIDTDDKGNVTVAMV